MATKMKRVNQRRRQEIRRAKGVAIARMVAMILLAIVVILMLSAAAAADLATLQRINDSGWKLQMMAACGTAALAWVLWYVPNRIYGIF